MLLTLRLLFDFKFKTLGMILSFDLLQTNVLVTSIHCQRSYQKSGKISRSDSVLRSDEMTIELVWHPVIAT